MSDLTITDFVGEAWWFIAAVLIVGFAIQGVQHRRIRKRFGTGQHLHTEEQRKFIKGWGEGE